MGKIVIAGGTGFIGRALMSEFSRDGAEVVILTRRSVAMRSIESARQVTWDAKSAGDWCSELEEADAVINLSGVSIEIPWTPQNREAILSSRVESTRAIAEAVAACQAPPAVWVNASAVGFYGDRGDEELDESKPRGSGFLADVCAAWEEAANAPMKAATRRVQMRTGVVLSVEGGALVPLTKLTKCYLGGAAGSGRQWMSWISLNDVVAMYRFAISRSELSGAVNACAPSPVRNGELMSVLRHKLSRPWSPPIPTFALKAAAAFGAPDSHLTLDSTRCVPKKAQDYGFEFQNPTLESVLVERVSRPLIAEARVP